MRYPEEIMKMEEMVEKLTKIRDELLSIEDYCHLHSTYGLETSEFPYIAKALNEMKGDIQPDVEYVKKSIAFFNNKIAHCKDEFEAECNRVREYILEDKEFEFEPDIP